MNTHSDKTTETKSNAVANGMAVQQGAAHEGILQLEDNRPEAIAQRKIQDAANNSPQVNQLKAVNKMVNSSRQVKQLRAVQSVTHSNSTQLKEINDEETIQNKSAPVQKKENKSGLPDNLKSGVENLSGYSLDDVKVHYNSDKPAQLNALAYAQGTDIHVASGQEKHLPHEAWHVVQQKQGRVQPNIQMKQAAPVNDRSNQPKETTVSYAMPIVQRLAIVSSDPDKQLVKAHLLPLGRNNWTEELSARIGSTTIVNQITLPKLVAILDNYNWDVNLVAGVLNEATLPEVLAINAVTGVIPPAFFRLGELRIPSDNEIDRYYVNYLRVETPGYAPNMFDTFRNNMRANGGQYWDFTAHQFRRITEAFRDVYNNAPVAGAVFSVSIYTGQNVDFVNHVTVAVANWNNNPAHAIGYELNSFLANLPLPYGRPFTNATRLAVSRIQANPQAAQQIINLAGPNLVDRLNQLIDAVSVSVIPNQLLNVLAMVLAPPVGVAHAPGFVTAINHMNELAEAQPRLNPLTAGMPFGNREGGLSRHFTKHPLGVQAAAFALNADWESRQWMTILGLAPNGLITKANLPNLVRYSENEWRIFAQHAHYYYTYRKWYYNTVTAASTPTNNTERDELISYLRANAPNAPVNAGPEANSIAAAHQNVYQAYVSAQFDAAPPNRYLCWDNGNLKVIAMVGNLFMVAAWNGAGNFDLSTGFLINGGAAGQFAHNLPTKIMNV